MDIGLLNKQGLKNKNYESNIERRHNKRTEWCGYQGDKRFRFG